MKKKSLILVLLIVGLFAISGVNAAELNNETINMEYGDVNELSTDANDEIVSSDDNSEEILNVAHEDELSEQWERNGYSDWISCKNQYYYNYNDYFTFSINEDFEGEAYIVKGTSDGDEIQYGNNWVYYKDIDDSQSSIRINLANLGSGYYKLVVNKFNYYTNYVSEWDVEEGYTTQTIKTVTFHVAEKAAANSNKKSNIVGVKLNKNHKVKVGKYTIKLTTKQYNYLIKSYKKNKSASITIKTGYKYKVKKAYTKKIKKYKTTKAVKTWLAGSYLPMIKKMKSNGWKKVSEYTYNKKNPLNKKGIGLSSYTYAVCKWVKTYKKTAYKTKLYPVKAKITLKSNKQPKIKVYSKNKIFYNKYLIVA